MARKSRAEKAVLSRQEIALRRREISDKRLSSSSTIQRTIVAIVLGAASLLALVSLATFVPGGHNAAGPVGYLLANGLRSLLGVGAYALPIAGLYAAGALAVGRPEKRRWPQVLAALLLLPSILVLAQISSPGELQSGYPPGGQIGAALADVLMGFFSTVGTLIIVSALASVGLIIGTEDAFLRVLAALARVAQSALSHAPVFLQGAWEKQKAWWTRLQTARSEAKLQEAAFLAQLEADESELTDAERDAAEAEAVAEEAHRLSREAEQKAAGKKATQESAPAPGAAPTPNRRREPRLATPPAPSVSAPTAVSATPVALAPADVSRNAVAGAATVRETSTVAATTPTQTTPTAPGAARTPVIVEPKAPPKPTRRDQNAFEFVGGRTRFTLPPPDVLEADKQERTTLDREVFLSTAEKLRAKLADFGIDGEVVEIRPGPVVTMYEFLPGPGIKVSKIASLADDLAMAMEAMRVRIVAPIPGKGVVGIEVPNRDRETVFLKSIAEQDAFTKSTSKLTMCVGKDIEGMPYVLDLAKAPHLLIAGTTGSGKSVAVNSMIMSLLLKATPEEVRFIMVDPKRLELSVYEGIPHLLLPVVTDPKKAALALRWAVEEMERRYQVLSEAGVRNIAGYNKLVDTVGGDARALKAHKAKPAPSAKSLVVDVAPDETEEAALARQGQAGLKPPGVLAPMDDEEVRAPISPPDPAPEKQLEISEAQAAEVAKKELSKLPYIVVIIDELADLMMVASREVETYVARLAQMARAAGIHLMVATQRPSTDVVTGVIKANFPTRVSFMLRSKPDSMTILGTTGAEALLGMGDMLIMPPTSAHLQRVHGAFVSEVEIKRAVDHLKAQGKPVYDESILRPREDENDGESPEDDLSDELYDQALAVVTEMRQVSISMLQRKMRIGYNRAARMIERMERDGIVGAADGAKPRDVLMRSGTEMTA